MGKSWIWVAMLTALSALAPAAARAQSNGLYAAPYCEPMAGTRLLYTNRAYEVEPKALDAPPLYYTYRIVAGVGASERVERRSQLLFDNGVDADHWDAQTGADEFRTFWPLQPNNQLELDRVDRKTGVRGKVSFMVLGLDPIETDRRIISSWKIRRFDRYSDGATFIQFLWYAPELCTLAAFTDSQHRMVRLLRVLRPGDPDYDRPLDIRKHHLYFSDTGELVR